MLPKKPWHTLYVLLFTAFAVIGFTALANSEATELLERARMIVEVGETVGTKVAAALPSPEKNNRTFTESHTNGVSAAPLFSTIIQGADEVVGCSVQGFSVARFNLCGDSDDRLISLSGGPYGSVSWEILGGSCTPDINEDCPNTGSCYTQVGNGQTFALSAAAVPATIGAEYRVIADGQVFYFKVKKSTITQTFIKQDAICGVPGRIQITNLSSAYEYSMDGGATWQGPIFNGLAAGTYTVIARLQNTPNTCEYPYAPITIAQLDMDIEATITDALCIGDTGTITVAVNNVPGPFKYTLINSSGAAQEFTAFVPDNPYTFNAVGFGTYTVQVETLQCTGDPLSGIDPPRQSLDTSGNPLTIGAGISPLDASTEVNSSFGCSTISDVDITLNVNGGVGPYTYTVNGGPVQPAFGDAVTNTGTVVHTVLAAGTYDFLITDANGCTITASSNVEQLLPPDISVSGTDGNCTNGGAQIVFTVNDARGYNLSFRASASDPWVVTPQLSVPATETGTLYDQLEVRYQQGGFECTLGFPDITVSNVGAITGTATKVNDVSCDGTGGTTGGQIDFVGPFTGGSGSGYTFSLDGVNFTTLTSYPNLPAGTYTPIIRDGGGCRLSLTPIDILPTDPPIDIDFVQSNINCATGTSDVQLTGFANAAIVRYEIMSPTYVDNGGNDLFTGLSTSQSYMFRITDANGCTYTEGFSPAVISSIRVRVKSGGDLRVCNGASDGTGTFIVDGFANNYTYDINGGLFTGGPQNDAEVALPLSGPGTYTITVTDVDTGCTDTASFDIQEAAVLDLSGSTVTPMSCANGNLGRVRANATGGWGGYRYTLTPPSGAPIGPRSGRTFGNLALPGTYVLSVEDSEGCTDTFTFDLVELTPPTLSIASADLCFSPTNNGSVTVASSGGGTGHRYRIENGTFQPSPTFTGLVPGTYDIEVEDDNNCRAQVSVTIPPQLNVGLSLVSEITCGGNGFMRISVNGGDITNLSATSYTVFRNGTAVPGSIGLSLPSGSFNYTVPSGQHGTYTVSVTDNNGCTDVSEPLVFAEPTTIVATHRAVGPSCLDANSGFIEIRPDPTMGVPPFEIKFGPDGSLSYGTSDDGIFAYSSQTVYSGLAAGTYEYVVKDSRGCLIPGIVDVGITPDPVPVPDATVAPIDATCSVGLTSGGIQISGVSGGTAEFTYIVEDNFGNEITRIVTDATTVYPLDILDAAIVPGAYTVVTLDSRGCTDLDTVNVGSATVAIVPDNTTLPPTCAPGGFTYCVDIVGGTGPFDIRTVDGSLPPHSYVSLGGTPPTPVRRHCFNNIELGEVFTVEVVDTANGCVYEQVIEVPDGPSPVTVSLAIDNATCIPGNLVGLTYTVTGATGMLDIEIRNTDTGALFLSESTALTTQTYQVPEGPYSILVYDNGTACSDGARTDAVLNMPRVDVIENINANCNADGQLTVRGSGGTPFATGSPYEYAYVPAGNPVDVDGTLTPTDPTDDFTDASTVILPGAPAPGLPYDIWVRDARNCAFQISTAIVTEDPPLPGPTFDVSNQCDVTAASFTIEVHMPVNINAPNFTLGGVSQFGVFDAVDNRWEAVFTVGSVGTYRVDVVDANGCTGFSEPEVFQVLSASGGFSTDPTCTDADGIITVVANGGSGDFSFELQDAGGTPITTNPSGTFTNLVAGAYQVLVTDNQVTDGTNNCTVTVTDIISTSPTLPLITGTGAADISCFGANDGSINVALAPGSDVDGIVAYHLFPGSLPLAVTAVPVATNTSGSFAGLAQGNYVVQVVSALGCTDERDVLISEPPAFSITASAPPFACEPGANRFSSTIITVNVVDPGTVGSGYQYSITGFSNFQTSNTFEIVDNGSPRDITVYAVDGNGCQTTFNVPTIAVPTDVVPVIVDVDPLTCATDERVRIEVTGTANFTVNTVSVSPVAPVTNSGGTNFVDVFLPDTGDYFFEITDNDTGCTYPMPVHTVVPPEVPTVSISEAEPVSCFGSTDGALFIEVGNYTGPYTYNVYDAADLGKTTSLASGSFDTANVGPARITGLPGGNLLVEVVATGSPFCSNDSNVANIRTPNGPLVVSATPVGNVGCNNDLGEIEAIGSGGWDNAPYEYRLLLSGDGGTTYTTEVAPFSANDGFTALSFGFYRVEVRDVEGCTAQFDMELEEVPQILAGIREPQGLLCPNGNNAVLEAFDPSTGDAITATSGATGGFPGAGYNYRLLYLNGNDNTDIASASGLQNTPTFIGATGGFISAGWYAIEVSSSYDCIFVTDPYFVDPPPPVAPLLVQTQVPGCGGIGEMRLSIENPEAGFTYEYAPVENGVVVGPYQPLAGTSVLIPGVQGITYQFDVRKVTTLNSCNAVRSNGITMTNATGITLLPNLPDDISCASELDGRIESFVNGGVGNNLFSLYIGDPVDGFSPSATATLFRGPQDNGTFEALPPNTEYYIAVTSGANCMDVAGPFVVNRPDPIVFNATPAPISCHGGEDGSITIEVQSGGVGLVQFAIAPNFNEFFSDVSTPGQFTFTDLAAGSYEILIQDENGCFEKDVIMVPEPDPLSIDGISTDPELCIGANDGRVAFNISGGTPFNDSAVSGTPYYLFTFEMLEPVDARGTEAFAPFLGQPLEDLQGGASYVLVVQDANGCETMEVITIDIGVDLNAQASVAYGCEGIFPNSTATVVLQDQSMLGEVLFALNPQDPTDAGSAMAGETYSWGDLPPGDHSVYVYHFNGCTNRVDFTIDPYEPLTLTVNKTGPNELVATAEGGFGGYEYFFNGESYGEENVFTTNESMVVVVRAVDQNGCTVEVSMPFEFTGMLEFPNFFTPDGDNLNDHWFPRGWEFFPNLEVKIYDRYGRVVAILQEVKGWDGTYDGKEVPTGDYWYEVNANDKSKQRYFGHFTLYR
ncbi:T9SS type B sorting domain-containing protein [Maribacter sp. 2307ULW6-5]|uniref:T9SS type B sorting domain-containing protein n=1 Tax=Maribacter sp. 2307ULW6-5 TaxID=3386275 RepID=UPI0039BD8306